jgi:hypothetical protein
MRKRYLGGVIVAAALAYGFLLMADAFAQTVTYLPPGRPFEAQSWWTPKEAEDGEPMHVHLGSATSPLFRTISGSVAFNVTAKLHFATGGFRFIDSTWAPRVGTRSANLLTGDPTSVQQDGTYTVTATTTGGSYDGIQRYTIQSQFVINNPATPAVHGKALLTRLRGHTRLANGTTSISAMSPQDLIGSAWFAPADFEGRGYSTAQIASRSIPTGPVSGIWAPLVMVGSSESGQTRHLFVTVDPDFHNHHHGWVIADVPNVSRRYRQVFIDTTKLANGMHRLFVKASDKGMFPTGTLEGAIVLGFEVQN